MVRDRKPKPEIINRLSPVDLPSYQKVELDQVSEYEHRKPLVKNQVFLLNKKQNKNNSKYYVEDIPKIMKAREISPEITDILRKSPKVNYANQILDFVKSIKDCQRD